ncbi:GDSL family lipase [Streptomyces griseocarneus]|nr:GDSL family lipase [Streptomyces griseocarneus]
MSRTSTASAGRRRARLALAACGAAAALVAGALAPATAASQSSQSSQPVQRPRAEHYVALGDSFTSGPFIPTQVNRPCVRSSNNYPSLTAGWLTPASFQDVSCGSATTDDMWREQPGTGNPAQLDALKKDTTLVSLGIGGNDIGFGEIIARCTYGWPRPIPDGNPCEQRYTSGGVDELAERIMQTGPKVADVLQEIHKRSPHARVLVVGYPSFISERPEDAEGCKTSMRIPVGDIPYLRETLRNLNTMLSHEARAGGATYVDTFTPTLGHDACRSRDDRWVEGMVPVNPREAMLFHPNAKGEAGMAEGVKDTLSRG